MHTKAELESLTIEQLQAVAAGFNIPVKNNPDKLDLIYSILDAESAQLQQTSPRNAVASPKQRKQRWKLQPSLRRKLLRRP